MDYAFFKATKFEDTASTPLGGEVSWLQLSNLISVTPKDNGGSVLEYFDGVSVRSIIVGEAPEGIFGSVVFVKSPTAYYVDPTNPTMPDME
jgi:hypothetical protein